MHTVSWLHRIVHIEHMLVHTGKHLILDYKDLNTVAEIKMAVKIIKNSLLIFK